MNTAFAIQEDVRFSDLDAFVLMNAKRVLARAFVSILSVIRMY